MTLRVPAFEGIQCPKCSAENIGAKHCVWKVADERGLHFECDTCAHAWPDTGQEQQR